MPRKKVVKEVTDAVTDTDVTEVSQSEETVEPVAEKRKRADLDAKQLDPLDFYITQLKIENTESKIEQANWKAYEANSRLLETSKGMGDEVGSDTEPDVVEDQTAKDRIKDLSNEISAVKSEKDHLNFQVAKLRNDLSRMYHEGRPQSGSEYCGIITRVSPETFTSMAFRDGRYEVRLARDGSYIKFRRNVEGKATCIDNCITLPMLPGYIPFSSAKEYGIIPVDANTLMIRL